MRSLLFGALATVLALSWGSTQPLHAQADYVSGEGFETLTRGPLHEAFAEPLTYDEESLIIAVEPPAPIEELPPEYRPDDDDAAWIPGYWAWDEEREDFIWISGLWRVPPPGQRWVPGYWQPVRGGYEWVAGFWVSAQVEELVYRETVPVSLEVGPTSPAPGEDYFYVPGNWHYTTVGYRWQPGYWHQSYENWIWVPARWIWTPRGVVFVNGYWDYRLPQRGFIFAPVYFSRHIWTQPRFFYRPAVIINVNVVFNHLFVRPGYRHYYFGDWYGDRYARYNIVPAFQWHTRRGGYDPVISYYSTVYRRRGEDFISLSRDRYRDFVRYEDRRPPRTWTEMERRVARVEGRTDRLEDRVDLIAERLDAVARDNRRRDVSFVRLEERQSDQIRQRAREFRELTQERTRTERVAEDRRSDSTVRDSATRDATRGEESARMRLPRSADADRGRDVAQRAGRERPGRDDVPRVITSEDPSVQPERGSRPDFAGRPDRG